MAYGPHSYLWSAVVGFVLGTFGFLFHGWRNPQFLQTAYTEQLPVLAAWLGGGVLFALAVAAVLNLLIGRQVKQDLDMQRALFSGDTLPPPMPRPDVPGFMLEKTRIDPERRERRADSEAA